MAGEQRLLTLDDAARALSISRRTLDRLVAAGDIRTIHVSPRVVRVEVDEVERYLRVRRPGTDGR